MQIDQRVRTFIADVEATVEDLIQFGMNACPSGSGPDPGAILYAPSPITIGELLPYREPPARSTGSVGASARW
jgi:hypothetical protein